MSAEDRDRLVEVLRTTPGDVLSKQLAQGLDAFDAEIYGLMQAERERRAGPLPAPPSPGDRQVDMITAELRAIKRGWARWRAAARLLAASRDASPKKRREALGTALSALVAPLILAVLVGLSVYTEVEDNPVTEALRSSLRIVWMLVSSAGSGD